jgi:hypothetical protein
LQQGKGPTIRLAVKQKTVVKTTGQIFEIVLEEGNKTHKKCQK